MTTTWWQHNMAVAYHGSSTKHGTNIIRHRQQHKGQDGRDNNTSREAATTLNEEMEIKRCSLSVFLQLVPVANCSELKRGVTQECVGFGEL
jgi:hypothetical protein